MSIELQNISKTFGKTTALDQVSLTLEPGHIYGLLGSNGAGKTTLLSILTDRQRPDQGQVLVDGMPVQNNDQALSQDYALDLAKQFGLPLKKKITALSTGYSSIFRLILCLSVNTPYLIFDEPVLGLDAQHRDLFYRLLVEKFAQGESTILLSTHLISEVENLIDHTIILREGRVLRDAPTEELMANAYTVSGPAGLVDDYAAGRQVLTSHSLGGLKTVSIQGRPEDRLPAGLEQSPLRLQDYFINLQEAEDQERKEGSYGYEH